VSEAWTVEFGIGPEGRTVIEAAGSERRRFPPEVAGERDEEVEVMMN
jgi:hypothetical protein